MHLDSEQIGIYVFGGVVIAGTAVAVIVDLLRKNNDHLWEVATELKFRNDAADARIKQLEFANAEVVAYANARAEVPAVAPATATPVEAPAETPVAPESQPVHLTLPAAKIDLTPAPEKVEIRVGAVESRTTQTEAVPAPAEAGNRSDRRERKHHDMSPAVAAVAHLVEARMASPKVTEQPALRIPEVFIPVAVAETVSVSEEELEIVSGQPDPNKTLKLAIPVAAAENPLVEPAIAESVVYAPVVLVAIAPADSGMFNLPIELSDPELSVDVPLFKASLASTLEASLIEPVAVEAVAEPAATETEIEVPAATLVPLNVVLTVEAPAPVSLQHVALETVEFELSARVPAFQADPQAIELTSSPEAAEAFEIEAALPDVPMAGLTRLAFAPGAIAAPGYAEPMATNTAEMIDYELTAAAPFFAAALVPTLVAPPAAVADPRRRKNWSKILGAAEPLAPTAEVTLVYRPKIAELPGGFHPVSVLRQAADSRLEVTGMVLAIGVESSDPSGNEEVARFVQSLIQGRDFACQTDTDEFLLICPPDPRPSSQRKLGAIAEKLWDFQLSSMGTLDVQFCWGGFEARGVSVTEAVNAALDQMRETRNERRMAQENRAAVS